LFEGTFFDLSVVMRIAGRNDRLRDIVRMAAALAAVAGVAGCAGGGLPSISSGMPSWFTSETPATQAQAKAKTPGVNVEDDCPGIDVRTGAGTLANAAKSAEPTATDLRYQLTFVEMARQCFVDSGTMRMRVGVQGRVIVGPAGAPPQVTAPIRYAVVQEGVQPKTIVTKFRRVPVTLSGGTTTFTDIEDDLSFPLPPVAVLQAYVVYVGFDEAGDRGQPKARPTKKKAPPPRKLERSVAPEFRR
jgi:hypothetical protein